MNAIPKTIMKCDSLGCLRQVKRAPRIVIPSRTPDRPLHRPFKIMTTLHFCDDHCLTGFNAAEWLTDARKRTVEQRAKYTRPLDWKPDFEMAMCEMVLVTTPEYRSFLHYIGRDEVAY